MTYGTICFYTFLATVNASNLSVAIVPLTQYFHTTATRASYLVCFNTLMLGVGNIFWVPLMRVVGRRPTYLFAMMLLMACNVWSYESKTYDSLLAARIISGFAAAAGDAPVTAVAADLFPVTERGFVMMFFQFALSCGFFLGPLINAYVAQYTGGWQWTCGWIAIAAGVNCVVAVFTLWETSYPNRGLSTTIDPGTKARRGMISNMSLKRGYNRNISFLRSMYDILVLAIYPPVTWGGILVGVFVGWCVGSRLLDFSLVLTCQQEYNYPIGVLRVFCGAAVSMAASLDRVTCSLGVCGDRFGGLCRRKTDRYNFKLHDNQKWRCSQA
jgi:MFS family permease